MTQRSDPQNREIWKPIPGYEGLYEISNLGRVRSLDRIETSRYKGRGVYQRPRRERILKNQLSTSGYLKVTLHRNGKGSQRNIHRLIAEAFIPNPSGLPQINHKDGNKTNNSIDNLEWCTASYNSKHSYDVLGRERHQTGKYGAAHNASKAVMQLSLNGKLIKRWECASDAVREHGFDSGAISHCCRGRVETHHGFRWSYADDE